MPNPYETWGKYSPQEVIIFPKFHKNWAKIVDFLLGHSDIKIAFLMKLRLQKGCSIFIIKKHNSCNDQVYQTWLFKILLKSTIELVFFCKYCVILPV